MCVSVIVAAEMQGGTGTVGCLVTVALCVRLHRYIPHKIPTAWAKGIWEFFWLSTARLGLKSILGNTLYNVEQRRFLGVCDLIISQFQRFSVG